MSIVNGNCQSAKIRSNQKYLNNGMVSDPIGLHIITLGACCRSDVRVLKRCIGYIDILLTCRLPVEAPPF